jgi:hypothetical protein
MLKLPRVPLLSFIVLVSQNAWLKGKKAFSTVPLSFRYP